MQGKTKTGEGGATASAAGVLGEGLDALFNAFSRGQSKHRLLSCKQRNPK